jgi:cyanophycin synthetase
MLTEKELQKLHTNQRLLVKELQSRSVNVEVLASDIELLEAELDSHKEIILDRDSSINPYAVSVVCGDKFLAKKLLQRANISVPVGEVFSFDELTEALTYAQDNKFPLVVKPVFGSHGYDIHMDLENLVEVKDAIIKFHNSLGSKPFIIEQQAEGEEYRIFITKNGDYAVLHRDPSHVFGDGESTLKQLAEKETDLRMNPRTNCLCPILLDDTVDIYLASKGLSLDFIPDKDSKIYLRHNSNVAMGATCEDFTDKVHESVIDVCKKTLDVFHGLPYAGVDLMSKDITKEQTPDMYKILEVNSVPGLHMHYSPSSGKSRNLAKHIVDIMFPETRSLNDE